MIVSEHAASRVEQVETDYLRVRLGALAQLPGNPYGAVVRQVADAYAFCVRAIPNPLFNHVAGLTARAADQLADLARWYAGHGMPLRADVTPAQASPELLAALTAHGLSQTGFYAGLYTEATPAAVPGAGPGAGPGAAPGAVAGEHDHIQLDAADPEEFAQIYVQGFGFPAHRRAAMAVSVQVLAGRQDTSFYRARIGAQTAGVGLLFLSGRVGYLATAATLPEYRGRGLQTALIRHRLHAASLAGCDLLVGHAAAGSGSQRTMERCGLRLAYTKATWSTSA
jgi:ribosomal protein S18 acetylase RimI-like enzyme